MPATGVWEARFASPGSLRREDIKGMGTDWERQAVVEELTERITDGEFAGDYERLKRTVERADLLSERDRHQLLQYWMSKEREREQRKGSGDGSND